MKIVIYSTNGLNPHDILHLFNSNVHKECDYITTEIGLYELLNTSRYDLLVLDHFDFSVLSTSLRKLIDDQKNLAVLRLNANDSISVQDENAAKSNAILPDKLVLHKGEDSIAVESKHDRDIIRATAATLGHEINNPLMTIYANAEMVLKENPVLSADTVDKIKRISDEVDRIKKTTDVLIDLERVLLKETPAGNMIDIKRLIEDKHNDELNGEDAANKNLDIKPS